MGGEQNFEERYSVDGESGNEFVGQGVGGLHKERYRDENEQITYGRWQIDTAGGSGKAAGRGNEK